MSPAKDANLQVRIDAALLAEFRHYAEGSGTTMSQMVLRWIRGAVGGDGEPASIKQVLGGSGEGPAVAVPAAGVAMAEAGSGESIQLMRRQVELLEQLVAIAGKPAIPVATPAVGTAEAAVVRPAVPTPAVEAEATEPVPDEVEPAEPAPVVPAPAPAEAEAEDLLAAQRARRLAELARWQEEKAAENQAAAEAERVKAIEAAGHHTPAVDWKKVGERRSGASSGFEQQLREAAAAALEGAGMGGQQDASAEESASDQEVAEPAVQEPAVLPQVLADGQTIDVVATPADPGDDDLLRRVEELEQQERLMEDWLADIRAGGDPVAPPLPANASDADWEAAANDCLEARGRKALPELVEKVLQHWGRG